MAVAAVFSLAHKLQPAIIFIDEVDSFLGQRRTTDHEAMTNMKTEFMSLWDGFTTDRECSYPSPAAMKASQINCMYACRTKYLPCEDSL